MWARRLLSACALIVLAAAAYSPVREAGYVYEDSPSGAFTSAGLTYWTAGRTLTTLSLQLTPEPALAHLVNVGVHAVNALLVFFVLRRWLTEPVTWLATGIFLLHPIQTEAVAYVASRSELLSVFFILASVLLLRSRLWPLASLTAVAALLAKESSVVVVLLLPLLAGWLGVAVSVPVVYVGWQKAAALSQLVTIDPTITHGVFGHAAMQSVAVFFYLGLLVWPDGFTVDHDFDGVPAAVAVGAAVTLMALLTALPILLRRAPAVGRCLIWAVVALSIRFVVPSHGEYLNEHQLYLAMVGLSGLLALGLDRALALCWRFSLWAEP